MSVTREIQHDLSDKRMREWLRYGSDVEYSGKLPQRFWVPFFGFSRHDFFAMVRFWLDCGYTVLDWSEREITLKTMLVDFVQRCDLLSGETTAGGVTVIVKRPLLFNCNPRNSHSAK